MYLIWSPNYLQCTRHLIRWWMVTHFTAQIAVITHNVWDSFACGETRAEVPLWVCLRRRARPLAPSAHRRNDQPRRKGFYYILQKMTLPSKTQDPTFLNLYFTEEELRSLEQRHWNIPLFKATQKRSQALTRCCVDWAGILPSLLLFKATQKRSHCRVSCLL